MNLTDQMTKTRQRWSKWLVRWSIPLYILCVLFAVIAISLSRQLITVQFAVAALLGGAVGAVEILGRYRHAPLRAVLTGSGICYVLINVAASCAAYYLLCVFEIFPGITDADQVKRVLTAGFGSLVFMRSSLFKVRVGDADVGIGPAAILDTFLLVADRGVDRREAVARAQDVTALLTHVGDPRIVAKMLTRYSLALMQNVDDKTRDDLGAAITKTLEDKEVPDAIRMDIVALQLGVIVGPDVLEAAVEALGDRLNAAAIPPVSESAAVHVSAAAPPPVPATVSPSATNPASAAAVVLPNEAELQKEIENAAATKPSKEPRSVSGFEAVQTD